VIVLDASALVDVITDQVAAPWLLDRIAGEQVHAPSHQPAEVLSALARMVRAGDLEPDAGAEALEEAAALPQHLASPTPGQLHRAFGLGVRIRVPDALYVTLAEDLGCPLVTTDVRLMQAKPPCRIELPPRA
jgi:predicted nucleic acid-binding protein